MAIDIARVMCTPLMLLKARQQGEGLPKQCETYWILLDYTHSNPFWMQMMLLSWFWTPRQLPSARKTCDDLSDCLPCVFNETVYIASPVAVWILTISHNSQKNSNWSESMKMFLGTRSRGCSSEPEEMSSTPQSIIWKLGTITSVNWFSLLVCLLLSRLVGELVQLAFIHSNVVKQKLRITFKRGRPCGTQEHRWIEKTAFGAAERVVERMTERGLNAVTKLTWQDQWCSCISFRV